MEERRGQRLAGWAANVAMRALIVGFTVEAALATNDPRFDGKGIAVRHIVFAGACLTLAFPVLHRMRRPWQRYPVWTDALFLSILALDMAFNSLDLYERAGRLDLIPHAYGPAAGFATLRMLGAGTVPGMLAVNGFHLLLEVQEAVVDAVFATHNVHGWWDTLTDLGAGLAGTTGLALAWRRLASRRLPPRPRPPHRSYSAA
jgi:hypothetical protein